MNSKYSTIKHMVTVHEILERFVGQLIVRGAEHDLSKLKEPEKSMFDQYTEKLSSTEYGSPEYKECLQNMKIALNHHYKENRHHPEHYDNGINDMDLVDIIEMFADWIAASKRTKDGDPITSLNINQERFGMSPQLYNIFFNTIVNLKLEKD